jgi:hypothetical protein
MKWMKKEKCLNIWICELSPPSAEIHRPYIHTERESSLERARGDSLWKETMTIQLSITLSLSLETERARELKAAESKLLSLSIVGE